MPPARPIRQWWLAHSTTIPGSALERTKRLEGSIPYLYLDTVGAVTVGVGRMLPDADTAARLAFLRNVDDSGAAEQEIRDEFAVIQSRSC